MKNLWMQVYGGGNMVYDSREGEWHGAAIEKLREEIQKALPVKAEPFGSQPELGECDEKRGGDDA